MGWVRRWVLGCILATIGTVCAQSADAPAQPFKPEELEALVAPIALYPDAVLSQALMASTYPLEIVQAARWLKANPNVKGDAAVKAVENQTWDVSVKSLVAFPQVLEPMNDKLDWTQKLGDAFLAQEKDVLAAVQRLRAKAKQAGSLQSNEQQKVIVETAPPASAASGGTQADAPQTIIKVEPTNPQVIYVPAYNPTVVYGGWTSPAYPPYYWPPYPAYYPGGALMTGFAWGVGLAAAGALFSNCNWGGGDVNIDVNRATNIDRSFNRANVEGGKWKHDSSHRKGVAYRDGATRERYGNNVGGADRRNDFRGRDGAGGGTDRAANRQGERGRDQGGDRGGQRDGNRGGDRAGNREAGVADRAGGGQRGDADRGNRVSTADRGAGGADRGNRSAGGRDNAFQGVGGGNAAQRDFDRGRASSGGGHAAQRGGGGGGGGFHGGGGFQGGGGGGFGGGRGGGGGGRGGRR
ncbi:DUF3300 domain-containing protein [Cupriavidus pampae]|uniref:DUF3300 domain-containing protein n=1 Tax=Cupriavidus pampae TaxID=659251 RepID=A0ABN7XUB3_9BURK|nr:DUF3300 domain-containing protein [Cupriavidus pampae]CAG9164490.1 hypothetical protein LMG32289_00833 [Cupriavidus pampae]